MILLFNFYIYI